MAEVGLELDKFPSSKHFVSWLGLCPNKKVTGGKVKSSKTSKNTGRLAQAFREAANAVGNQKNTYLSNHYKAMAYRKGKKPAVISTARKIATIVFNMLKYREAYKPFDKEAYEKAIRIKKIKNIQRTMKELDITMDDLL